MISGPMQKHASPKPLLGDPVKWVTHKNVKVDRVVCPWLKTLIDPKAKFLGPPSKEGSLVSPPSTMLSTNKPNKQNRR